MENPTIETEVKPASSVAPAPPDQESISLNISLIMSLCALGLLICFFLPWITILGRSVSGFDIAQKPEALLLWLLPFLSVTTIIANLVKSSQALSAHLTGALPFLLLAYSLYQEGTNLLRVLGVGAHGSLLFGLVLLVLSFRQK